MRVGKFLSVLVFGILIFSTATLAASDSATTNATFVIPSWISLSVTQNENIDFPAITGPGSFSANNDAQLRVLSTASWVLTESILWGSSTLPAGANQTTIDSVFVRSPDITSGLWGISYINVAYSLVIAEEDLANMPGGTYQIIVQYTATTN